MYTQCNLDKILNSVTEAVFWCINLPVWLFFHCVKTAFGSQKNLIKRRKKWNFQKLTYYIALNIKYYSSYIYLVVYCYQPYLFHPKRCSYLVVFQTKINCTIKLKVSKKIVYVPRKGCLYKFILKVTKEKVESSGFVRQVFPVFPVIDNCLKFLNIKCITKSSIK